jgi:ABC-type transport system substrate-binding protein
MKMKSKMQRRDFLKLSATVMAGTVLAACAPTAQPTTEAAASTKPAAAPTTAPAAGSGSSGATSKIRVAIGADPANLAPFVGMSMGRIAVLKNIYEYLFEVDSMGGKAVPMLAKSVEKKDDKTYVVTLFDAITDSAGNKITAADVAWCYNTGMASGQMRPLGSIASVKATGDSTAEFVFKDPLGIGDLEKLMTECPIVSQKAYEGSADKFATKPVTTHPYVLKEYVPGSSLTFDKRADYWQKDASQVTLFSHANVQTIVYQVITEPAQHAIALETGNADVSGSVTGDDVARFDKNVKFTVFKFQDNLAQYLAFNGTDGGPFTKKELRQAVAYAIDTTAMCQAVAPGACAPLHTLGNSNFGGYQTKWDKEPYYEFDLAKAKEKLAASGAKEGLTVKLLAQNDSKSGLIAQVMQASLAQIGITVKIDQQEPSVYNQSVLDPKSYDLLIDAAAGGDYIVSPWLLSYDQSKNNGTTGSFFKDDKMQALLTKTASLEGFTPENVDAFQQYQKDVLYAYGVLSFMNNVVSVKSVTKIIRDTRGQIVPGACEYAS